MTEPIKPKRRVTAQIPISSSPKFPPNSSPQSTYPSPASRPAIRARVDPSSASGSNTPTSRPSLRPSTSTASIRASASLPAVPTLHAGPSRPRSPVRVRSPLPLSTGSSAVSSSAAGGGGTRARVRATSPAQGGLTSPLNQSYAQNASAGAAPVRARVTNVTPVNTGYGTRPKGFPSDSKDEGAAGPSQPRPKVSKSQTQPPFTPHPPAPRSRGSSVVSSSSSALAKVVSSPLHSPQLGPPISPAYSQHLQTPGAGQSTPGLGTDRRRSISPIRRVQTHELPPSTGPSHRPYPLTPTLAPMSSITNLKAFEHDPTASCPPSPHHPALPQRPNGQPRRLPDHPFSERPAALPSPVQPELKTVDLPPLSTTASREEGESGVVQGVDDGGGGVLGLGLLGGLDLEGRLAAEMPSGQGRADAVEMSDRVEAEHLDSGLEKADEEAQAAQVDQSLDVVVEEARINRKVADLEISNASLLAINRSLEISKSKQRAEILRLRRALRESLAGPILPSHPSSTSYFPASTPRPHPIPSSPFSRMFRHPLLDTESEEEDDLPGLETDLEARWAKLEDVLGVMQKRAEVAVRAVAEESRPAGRAVLGGWEDEEAEGEGIGTGGIGTPERHGEG